jgi:hypothetical protein
MIAAMNAPRPTDDLDAFTDAYSTAWTTNPIGLLEFFESGGSYTDMAMGTTYEGHEGILRFHRWMLKFAPDSVIDFFAPAIRDGVLYLEWLWSGSFEGALRLPDGCLIPSNGQSFGVPGIAACRYGTDGEPSSHRDFWDAAQLTAQLGTTA